MLSEMRPQPDEPRLFSDAEVDRIAEKRNRKVYRELAEMQEKHDDLKAQIESDNALIAERDELRAKIADMGEVASDEELADLQQRVNEVSERAEFYRTQYESDARRVALHKAAVETNAIDVDQLQAMLGDEISPDEIGPAVRAMRSQEKFANLFRPEISRGVGGMTQPGKAQALGFVSASRLASMSQAEYESIRKRGGLNDKLGPRQKY